MTSKQRVTASWYLVQIAEAPMVKTVETGFGAVDTPFVRRAQETANRIAEAFEEALSRHEITLEDLFDESYEPIPGTNPQQMMTKFVSLADRLLDRNGYVPTHMTKYSQPQRADVEWNRTNCRTRRFFTDRVGQAAAKNREPFRLCCLRRDLGDGVYATVKDVAAAILVRDRHWGNFRMAYTG